MQLLSVVQKRLCACNVGVAQTENLGGGGGGGTSPGFLCLCLGIKDCEKKLTEDSWRHHNSPTRYQRVEWQSSCRY